MSQEILLKIVKTWNINKKPEYRGFRCANCQKYIHKAWHRQLNKGGYRTPVHFCSSCEAKFKLKSRGIYKTFTCDKCNRKMHKAYHVWTEKNNIIFEDHFCKKCGNKLKLNKKIKGIIYDLDGTLISTAKLHELAWLYAGKKFKIPISSQMLVNQKGISNRAAASMILAKNKKHLIEPFIKTKDDYVTRNISKIMLFADVEQTLSQLLKEGYKVWICTSAREIFVKKVSNILKFLRKIKNNIIWREMYKTEKPSPEALDLTIKKMGLGKSEICYIGDAFTDYKTSIKTRVKFIYFCPNSKAKDKRIPKLVPVISSHRKIFSFLK